MKVLLVDDSNTIRSIQRNALRQLDFDEILEAEDGLQALAVHEAHRPDVILVDWKMPNMDGVALVRRIRERDDTARIILCTTLADKPQVLEAVDTGVDDHLVKPFTVNSLRSTIKAAVADTSVSRL